MSDGLKRIHMKGFGSLRDISLRPGRLTVLIGPNGAGKSQLLRGFQLLTQLHAGSLQLFVGSAGGASTLLHYGPKQTQKIDLALDFRVQERLLYYRATLGFAANDRLFFDHEAVGHQRPGEDEPHITTYGSGYGDTQLHEGMAGDATADSVEKCLAGIACFHFHDTSLTAALRTPSRAADDLTLQPDGANLASYLAALKQSIVEADQKAWRRIGQLVRRVCPSLKELAPTPVNSDRSMIRLDWIDDRNQRFGCHQLSDGTLRAIALITTLAQPSHRIPRFISIDEPELGLHPAAISLIAELARSVSHRTQVLFATQSAAFLDHFEPEEVVVVERVDGATEIKRLDEEALNGWLEDYCLSEIYDKGLIGGRP